MRFVFLTTGKALMIRTIWNYIRLDHSASSMHSTSVKRRPSKKKAPLAKRASVDDIATYSVDVPDGEVQRNVKPILCSLSSVNI